MFKLIINYFDRSNSGAKVNCQPKINTDIILFQTKLSHKANQNVKKYVYYPVHLPWS